MFTNCNVRAPEIWIAGMETICLALSLITNERKGNDDNSQQGRT